MRPRLTAALQRLAAIWNAHNAPRTMRYGVPDPQRITTDALIDSLPRKESMPPTKPRPTDVEKAIIRARALASREDYFVSKVETSFAPEKGSDLWEVLFLGRYQGNSKAGIRGDDTEARLTYTCWVRADGSGYVTAGW